MNIYLKKFVDEKFAKPGKALDLGAGGFADVVELEKMGWKCEGVDIKTGVDLEKPYKSKHESFDLVYSNYVMHKLKNKKQFVQTIYDNLKNGGWFFLHTFNCTDPNGASDISIDYLQNLLIDQGFENINVQSFDYFDDEDGHNHWHQILEASGQKNF